MSGFFYLGNRLVTEGHAVISAATSGNNTIVAAVTDKIIRVTSYCFIVDGAVGVRFESDADGTALTGVMSLTTAGEGISVPEAALGHFETASGELLNMELSAAVQVCGHLTYILLDP